MITEKQEIFLLVSRRHMVVCAVMWTPHIPAEFQRLESHSVVLSLVQEWHFKYTGLMVHH